jgi:hypothetical protein
MSTVVVTDNTPWKFPSRRELLRPYKPDMEMREWTAVVKEAKRPFRGRRPARPSICPPRGTGRVARLE